MVLFAVIFRNSKILDWCERVSENETEWLNGQQCVVNARLKWIFRYFSFEQFKKSARAHTHTVTMVCVYCTRSIGWLAGYPPTIERDGKKPKFSFVQQKKVIESLSRNLNIEAAPKLSMWWLVIVHYLFFFSFFLLLSFELIISRVCVWYWRAHKSMSIMGIHMKRHFNQVCCSHIFMLACKRVPQSKTHTQSHRVNTVNAAASRRD